jgi:hypothetical protein
MVWSFEPEASLAPSGLKKACIMYGLARCAAARNKNAEAYEYGQKSLSILESLGNHRAVDVRQWLTSLKQIV